MSADFRLDLPRRLTDGPPELVTQWNKMCASLETLERQVRARTLRPTPLLRVAIDGNGTTAIPKIPTGPGRTRVPPFAPLTITETGEDTYDCTMAEGSVIDHDTDKLASDAVTGWEVQVDTGDGFESLSARPRPVFELEVGETVYCKYLTSNVGAIKDDGGGADNFPQIAVSSSTETSTHYQPPDPVNTSGIEGEYWKPLWGLEAGEEEGDPPVVVIYQLSDIEHYRELPTFENLGTGKPIYKQRAGNEYEFLSLAGTDTEEPSGSEYVEGKTLVEFIGGATLADATGLKVRSWADNSETDIHPFKMSLDSGQLSVEWGVVTANRWYDSSGSGSGPIRPYNDTLKTTINGNYLTNNPDGDTSGSITVSGDVGVWLQVIQSVEVFSTMLPDTGGGPISDTSASLYSVSAEIITDATYLDFDDGEDLADANDPSVIARYFYIGKIVSGEIQQWRRSDIDTGGELIVYDT